MVDIGTNSMRLLITEDGRDVIRASRVTGLGVGVDKTGELQDPAVGRTVDALREFGRLMDEHAVERRAAMATSATRDASNREVFVELATDALATRPVVIDGQREGRLAFAGATATLPPGDYTVSDIGGGSTEFVTLQSVVSVDIGSVRLTDRMLHDRPASAEDLDAAVVHVGALFSGVEVPPGSLVGVAGTWTSLAALDLGRSGDPVTSIEGYELTRTRLDDLVEILAASTIEETRALRGLDPARAPVILGGALIARAVMTHLGADVARVSVRDTLDGRAAELADLP